MVTPSYSLIRLLFYSRVFEFSYFSRSSYSFEKYSNITPISTIRNYIPHPTLVFAKDLPSKIKSENITDDITPKIWPPNNNEPPERAYPMGNAVWLAKSVTVVRYGNMENPKQPLPTYKSHNWCVYSAMYRIDRLIRHITPYSKQFLL